MKTLYTLVGLCTLICMCNGACELLKAFECVQRFTRTLGTFGTPYLCQHYGLRNTSKCVADVSEDQECVDAYKTTDSDFLKKFHDEEKNQEKVEEACEKVNVFNKNILCINERYPNVVLPCITKVETSAEAKFLKKVDNLADGNDTKTIFAITCGLFDDIDSCIAEGFDKCGSDMTKVGIQMFRALAPPACDEGVFNTFSLLCLFLSFIALRQAV